LTNGLSAEALALTPAGYPGNESQIKTYTFQLGQVSRDLGIAKSDVKQIETIALATHSLHVLAHATAKFQRAQQALEHQIIARQVQLALLGTEVANATNLSTSDRSALVTILTGEQSALGTDATNAAAATTYAQLNAVQKSVVGDERVYAVVSHQVSLVIAADNDTVVEGGYPDLTIELTPLVTELGSKHASGLLADISSRVAAASSLTKGITTEVLALTPAGYPGNESQIKTYTFQLGQVSRDLVIAKGEVMNIEAIALTTPALHVPAHV
jgi:hypothetical protein